MSIAMNLLFNYEILQFCFTGEVHIFELCIVYIYIIY